MGVKLRDLADKVSDLFKIDPRKLIAREGWNVRLPGPELEAHIAELAESIREIGVKEPLRVKMVNGEIFITNGFCRHAAVMKLIAEGVDIQTVPAIPEDPHSNEADHCLSMLVCNSGMPLNPFEAAEVFKRLLAYGWDMRRIAARSGISVATIERSLVLLKASPEVQAMVRSGEVSASTAVAVVRAEGEGAAQKLKDAQLVAKEAGKERVLPRHLEPSRPRWSKIGPSLRDHLLTISRATDLKERDSALQSALAFIQDQCPELA